MKPALLKTLAIVLLSTLGFLLGWHLLHGGWENLKEEWTGKYRRRPYPGSGPLALGPDGYYWGGTSDSSAMPGYVYRMKADGSNWKIVHTFRHDAPPPFGAYPSGGLVSDGVDSLLGTTTVGTQLSGVGTLYKINAATGVLTTLVEFTGKNGPHKGTAPEAPLVTDGMGSFWGSTMAGGTRNSGTIFKFSPATGVFTTVVELPPSLDPEWAAFGPKDALVSDGQGYWWWTTSLGGAEHYGTVSKVNASTGVLTTVVEFTKDKGGWRPTGRLVSDGRGFVWGACLYGGQEHGTIFKIDPTTGALITLVEFTGNAGSNPGSFPDAALVSDGYGFLWGKTLKGGKNDTGTIFKVDIASGILTTLVEYDTYGRADKGYRPEAPLVSDGHGAFLGTTVRGGKKNAGTIFKIDIATGVLTTLVEFGKVGP